MDTTLGILAVIFAIAFLVETLVEFLFGTLFDKVPKLTKYKWTLMYAAVLIGLIGTFHYHFDLIAILGQFVKASPPVPVSWYGETVTGIAIGKGSNYLHQFISTFFPAKGANSG